MAKAGKPEVTHKHIVFDENDIYSSNTGRKSIKEHLNEFNRVIPDLKNINIKIEDEDQIIFLLCHIRSSYKHFIDMMMYGQETLILEEVKDALNSTESKKRISETKAEGSVESLFIRGRTERRNQNSGRGQSRSKSKVRPRKI